MRQQGRITKWKDDQGFGFITPKGGGAEVFVHIKSFSNRARRPIGNEIVTYDLATDKTGRPRAEQVAFTGERSTPTPARSGTAILVIPVLFLVFVATLLPAILALYLVASVVTFMAYARDKSAARNDRWRTPESTLHLLSLIGGWPGAFFAQELLRHKSRKQSFQLLFWATIVLNIFGLVWLLSPGGSAALRAIPGGR